MAPIHEIAVQLGLAPNDLELYGSRVAKVKPSVRKRVVQIRTARGLRAPFRCKTNARIYVVSCVARTRIIPLKN